MPSFIILLLVVIGVFVLLAIVVVVLRGLPETGNGADSTSKCNT